MSQRCLMSTEPVAMFSVAKLLLIVRKYTALKSRIIPHSAMQHRGPLSLVTSYRFTGSVL